jgi:hypothetical protein
LGLFSDDNGTTWANASQTNNSYNGDFISESISQAWDGSMWMNSSRDLFSYNGKDELTKKENFLYLNMNWQIFNENTYGYDALGNEISNTLKEWDFVMSMLENKERWTFFYTGTRKDQDIKETWTFANVWENDERLDYFYDNGLLERTEERTWTVSDVWSNPFKRTFFEYNANDLPSIITNQTFGSGNWNNTERTLNTYDSMNLTEIINQNWDSGEDDWEYSTRISQSYDGNNNILEQIFQNSPDGSTAWENFTRLLYFWSKVGSLSVTEVLSDNIKIYPNPTVEKVKIDFITALTTDVQVTVYDMLARKINGKTLKSGKQSIEIPMNNYKSGSYLIKLSSNIGTHTYKVVKK